MSDPIATVNAVKSGVFHCTIRSAARGLPLEGQFCVIDTAAQRILGRVSQVDLVNPIHEDPVFQPLISDRGRLDYFSGEYADIETCQVEVVSCVNREGGRPEARRGNPKSGTEVLPISDLRPFWRETQRQAIVGTLPGVGGGPVSVINKHYGDEEGGWGEAKHVGIFGQNGSGKTVLLLSLLAARMAANRGMGALLLDTKGDLAQDGHFDNRDSGFRFSFHDLLHAGGREFTAIRSDQIAIQRVEAFDAILTDWLVGVQRLGKEENVEALVHRARPEVLRTAAGEERRQIDSPGDIDYPALMRMLADHARRGWATKSAADVKADDLRAWADSPSDRESFERHVLRYFSGEFKIWGILDRVLRNGEIIMLKLASATTAHQERIVYELLNRLTRVAEAASQKRGSETLNSVVIIDEAHRWVPQGGKDRICLKILDAIRTTRAYHVGWWLVSQSMAGVDKEAMRQMHTKWFGRGLDTGADIEHLKNYLGQSGKLEYDTLNYQGGYFFLGTGQEINLGTGNSYQAAIGFSGDATDALRRANPHLWGVAVSDR